MAHHDGLTNLPNRELFQDRLSRRWSSAGRQQARSGAVCRSRPVQERQRFIRPSDGRSSAEDGRRAAAGRGARQQSGGAARRRRIRRSILASDVSPNEASDFADRLIKTLSAAYDIDGIEVVIGASIGIALSPGDGDDQRGTDAQRRHGAVSREGGWRRRASLLRTGNGPAGAKAPRHGARSAPRLCQWRIRAALPAAGGYRGRPDQRF